MTTVENQWKTNRDNHPTGLQETYGYCSNCGAEVSRSQYGCDEECPECGEWLEWGGDMRLIDADALIERIKIHKGNVKSGSKAINEVYGLAHDHIIDLVNNQPTAYDVEKVVAAEENFLVNFGVPKDTKVHKKIIGIIRKGGAE